MAARLARSQTREAFVNGDALSDAQLLLIASAFDLIPFNPRGPAGRLRQLRVERRSLEPEAWAIMNDGGSVLSREGEWEYEPFPSSRDDAFLSRCRWPSARAAIEFARSHIRQFPSGYKPEDD